MNRTLRTLLLYFFLVSVGTFQACSCDDPSGTNTPSETDVAFDTNAETDAGADTSEEADPCSTPDVCRPDQICTSSGAAAQCSCPAGSTDVAGECVEDEMCTATTCGAHGTCVDSEDGPRCTCETGWTGEFCGSCDEAGGWQDDGMGGCTNDPCSLIECGDQVCDLDGQGTPVCVCPAGTHPEGDICVPDTNCMPNSCSMQGTCDDAGGSVSCSCNEGFAGEACAECDQAAGYHDDGMGGCTTDPCLPNPCNGPNETICAQAGNSYVCECDPGYHDEGGSCVVDEVCAAGSCSGNGTCDDTGGIITCTCDAGYAGDTCDSCDSASGYHLDGMGGCTTDPCLPNPCMQTNKTQCTSQGTGYQCICEAGYHPDGAGGCTDDPCTPDPCAANNQACQVVNGMAQCYTPVCDDSNPCTDDTLVNGVCQYDNKDDGSACSTDSCVTGESCTAGVCGGGTPLVCDDSNPCTDDSCDSSTGGCNFVTDDTNVPDDGVTCTVDTCSNGFASHTPSDAQCDDALYCNGEEVCAPSDPAADADGCLTQSVPVAPPDPGPCSYYGPCDESTNDFELLTRSPGASCNDGILCTAGDVCTTSGNCEGTIVGDCGFTSCSSTTPFPNTIDIPDASITLNITLDGQPLATTGHDPTSHVLYAVARDTGARHLISSFRWDNFYTPSLRRDDAERLMPGVYDILYRKGETSNYSGYVYRTDSNDIGPNGVRLVASDVYVYAGSNTLDIDIPQTAITLDITLAGQPLPTTGHDPTSHLIYAVSKDTGARHLISVIYWDNFYTPSLRRDDAERLMPGTYDILYRKGETSNDSGYVYRTDSNDIGPNGVIMLAKDFVVSGSSATIPVDIPQTDITLDITLGGQPLPTTGHDPTSHLVYAVNEETGARHLISVIYWDNFYTPSLRREDAERLMPGTYDILYRKGETSNSGGYVHRTDANDIGPNGVRILVDDLVVSGSSQTIAVDIPQADITLDITLDGQPLPTTGHDPTSHLIYAVASDTGVRHLISVIYWDNFYTPNLRRIDAERLIPGTYDILYEKGRTSNYPGYVHRTDSNDIGPNGARLLATDVVVTDGTNTIPIDIGQTPVSFDITLDGQPLATTGHDPTSHLLYAVARDTGARHLISVIYWDNFYTPNLRKTDAERLMPGAYDILYIKGETSNASGYVYRTDSNDIGPNGVRLLASNVMIAGNMSQVVSIDIPDSPVSFDLSLAGQSLPTTGHDPTSHVLYAVSRDTNRRHMLTSFRWDNFYTPSLRRLDTERLMPGTYDILYRKGETSNDLGYVHRTDSNDIGPNGVRYVGVCVEVP